MPVLNKYHFGGKVPPNAINIMRGTQFGNPFVIGRDGSREDVIEKYRAYLWRKIGSDAAFRQAVADLHNRTLCCCCAPAPCHGDVLLKAAAWLNAQVK